jgi:hypothetical protein
MKSALPFNNEKMISELATLSRDPALAFRPDPGFRVLFRNPDEITEGDFNGVDTSTRLGSATTPHWAGAVSWRRSPKE